MKAYLKYFFFFLALNPAALVAQNTFAHHHGSNAEDEYKYLLELNNGNFLACGWGGCNKPLDYSANLTLFDPKGNILKEWACGERDYYYFGSTCIIEGEPGEYFVGGAFAGPNPSGNPHLIKILSDGTILKDTFYGIGSSPGGNIAKMCYHESSEALFTIGLGSTGGKNCMIMQRIDKNLNRIWLKYLTEFGQDVPRNFFVDSVHNELILFTKNLVMCRIDPLTGNVLSSKFLYDINYCQNDADYPISSYIIKSFQVNDSVYTICYNQTQEAFYHFIDIDRFGNTISVKKLSSKSISDRYNIRIKDIHSRKNGGYVIYTYQDTLAFLGGFDADLNNKWEILWRPDIKASLTFINESRSGGTYGCGAYRNNYTSSKEDFFIFHADSNCRIFDAVEEENLIPDIGSGLIYPNPSHEWAIIKTKLTDYSIRIYSTSGALIRVQTSNTIDTKSLTDGLYFITLESNESDERRNYKLTVVHP